MEKTGSDTINTLRLLSDQLGDCKADAARANLMAEDLTDYFDIGEDPDDNHKLAVLNYFQENGIRAEILLDYVCKALAQVTYIHEQVSKLHDQLRQEKA